MGALHDNGIAVGVPCRHVHRQKAVAIMAWGTDDRQQWDVGSGMILFDLKCGQGHRFEGWFRNNDAYEQQVASHALTCPVCGDVHVEKAPMAPRIAKSGRTREAEAMPAPAPAANPEPAEQAQQAEMLRALRELRRQVEANAEHVGDRFAEEARKIHYGETQSRAIYGETSQEQAEKLQEEGVAFARIPWLPTGN